MKIEIRSANEAIISGYVNAVERDSKVLSKSFSPHAKDNFVERVRAKTFDKALNKNSDIELRFNHGQTLGSTKNGTVKLFEDNIGLYAEARITDPDIIKKAKDNELRGWSFGFTTNHDEWEDVKEGLQRRYLDDINLLEVSILDVTPAYIATSIEMRGENCSIIETRGCEDRTDITENPCSEAIEKMKSEILRLRGIIYEN